jgi:DNA-binding response OmpR family regulator
MYDLVLIIDQESVERRFMASVLAADGFDLIQVASVVEGMVEAMSHDPALIIVAEETDPVPVDDVIALLRRLTEVPLIVVGSGGDNDELTSLKGGGDYYLARPFGAVELAARTRLLIKRSRGDIREIARRSARAAPPAGQPAMTESPPRGRSRAA